MSVIHFVAEKSNACCCGLLVSPFHSMFYSIEASIVVVVEAPSCHGKDQFNAGDMRG